MAEAVTGATPTGRDARLRRLSFLLEPRFWLHGRGFYAPLSAFFLFAAIVQTWPLVLHASGSIISLPARPEDSWAYLWNLWWVKDATLHLQNPLVTDSIFYPQGADLQVHTLTTINGLMSIPLQLLTGNVILSWNILALILFALSGLTTYALAKHVSGSRGGALVAAYAFTFSPFVIMRLHGGHWNISTVWMLPLLALLTLLFRERGQWRYAVAAGAVWALITYNSQEYGADSAFVLALYFLYWTAIYVTGRKIRGLRRLWLGAPVIIGVWFVLAAPLLIPAFEINQRDDASLFPGGSNLFTDLEAFVTPSPLWGPGELPSPVPDGSKHFPTGDLENTVFLGITTILLAVAAIATVRSWRHPAVFWALIFVFFAVLALGPHLFIGDTKDFSVLGVDFTVPLPYQLYEKLPVLDQRRGISRLIVYGHLALVVLAALGARRLLQFIPAKHRHLAPFAAVALLSLVALEFWTPPNVTVQQPTPAAIEAISHESGDFTVIHAPIGRATWTVGGSQSGAQLADYYARIHEKSTVGGYISRAPYADVAWPMSQPALKYLSCPTCSNFPGSDDVNVDIARRIMRDNRVRYIILHRLMPGGTPAGGPELDALDSYIRSILGMVPEYEDPSFTIYRNPEVAR